MKIDKQLFHTRLGNFISTWKDTKKNEAFAGAESIVVVMGKTEEGPYSKSLSLHVSLPFSYPSSRLLIGAVLVAWIRVPGYPLFDYAREVLRRYHG